MELQVTLPCLPAMVPVVRRLVRGLMPDCPCVCDAELIFSELYGNVVRYGSGEITVSITTKDGWARLAVTDCGSAPPTVLGESAEADAIDAGRGLLIVGRLSDRWGHEHEFEGNNTIWAELKW